MPPMLPELLDQIPGNYDIRPVTADGAYDTRKRHDAVADRGAHAVLLPRKNAKPWKPGTAGALAIALEPMADKARPATKPSERQSIWADPHGAIGVGITAEATRDEDAPCEAAGPKPHGPGL